MNPFFKKNEITYLNKCINQKIVSTHGKLTEKFEKKIIKIYKNQIYYSDQ